MSVHHTFEYNQLPNRSTHFNTRVILMCILSIVSYLLKITKILQIVSALFLKIFIYFTDIKR